MHYIFSDENLINNLNFVCPQNHKEHIKFMFKGIYDLCSILRIFSELFQWDEVWNFYYSPVYMYIFEEYEFKIVILYIPRKAWM